MPRDRAGGTGAPGLLEDDAEEARAADAMLEVREEGCRGGGVCEAPPAGCRRTRIDAVRKCFNHGALGAGSSQGTANGS